MDEFDSYEVEEVGKSSLKTRKRFFAFKSSHSVYKKSFQLKIALYTSKRLEVIMIVSVRVNSWEKGKYFVG